MMIIKKDQFRVERSVYSCIKDIPVCEVFLDAVDIGNLNNMSEVQLREWIRKLHKQI